MPTTTRQKVYSVLDHVNASVDGLEAAVLRDMLPVLSQAHDEVQAALQLWLSRQHGGATFTAQRYRNVLVHLRGALTKLKHLGPVTEKSLKKHYLTTIGPLSVRNVEREWKAFSSIFEGTVQPIALEEAALISSGRKLLWPQFESSAKKYAGSIGDKAKRELAVSRARSETIDELTTRLQKKLPNVFRSNRSDAERLARTESQEAYNVVHHEAILAAHEEDPELRERWDASYDFRRCPMCASLDGQVIDPSKGEKFVARWETASKKGVRLHVKVIEHAIAHPRCVPGNVLVRSSRVLSVSKRWYDGDLVVIRTASGKCLPCTPNHPILTGSGWVQAGRLNVGGHVIRSGASDGTPATVNVYDQDAPSRIEEIADAFGRSQSVTSVPVPTSPEDFHGDGKGSKVAVVWADRLLLHAENSAIYQHPEQYPFDITDAKKSLLYGCGPENLLGHGLRSPSGGIVRSTGPGHSPLWRHPSHGRDVGLALPPWLYSAIQQNSPNGSPAHSERCGDSQFGFSSKITAAYGDTVNVRDDGSDVDSSGDESGPDGLFTGPDVASEILDAGSGLIFADKIVDINVSAFHGFVYNLQTVTGDYEANGIVTHNCRCVRTPWRASWAEYSRNRKEFEEGGRMAA